MLKKLILLCYAIQQQHNFIVLKWLKFNLIKLQLYSIGPVELKACAGANLKSASEIYAVDCIDFRYKITNLYYGANHYINFKKDKFYNQINTFTKGKRVDKILVASGDITNIGEVCECLVNGGVVSNVNYLGKGKFITISCID